jgi:hypothetical protein
LDYRYEKAVLVAGVVGVEEESDVAKQKVKW